MSKYLSFTLTYFILFFSDHVQGNVDQPDVEKGFYFKAVTYDLEGGRFGDRLLNYLHAKWISYKYDMPLFYKPFLYSEQLVLHREEQIYQDIFLLLFQRVLKPSYDMTVDFSQDASILYVLPYFPENIWEHTPEQKWYYLKVDWEDPVFKEIIAEKVKPLRFQLSMALPQDRLTVAVHVRKGGGFDTEDAWKGAPLKFPPESYYISQISKIITLFDGQPLYFYIFTDDQNPLQIVERFKSHFAGDIQWDCRNEGNHHTSNVLEDFFEMMRFDCLIRPDSNYSFIVSKLKNFKVTISPLHFRWDGASGYVDEVEVILNDKLNTEHTKEILHVFE